MPSLDFTLPHWAYWVGLIVFPLVAMTLAKRRRNGEKRYSLVLAYFILVTGGILGLHRIYLKSLLGLAFLPVFGFILFANGQANDARSALSDASNLVRIAQRTIDREEPRLETARAEIPDLEAEIRTAEPESFSARAAERRLERARRTVETGEARLAESRAELERARPVAEQARMDRQFWNTAASLAFYLLLLLVAIDACLMPFLVRRANATISDEPMSEAERALRELEERERKEDAEWVSEGWTGWIDRLSLYCGEFVAYWAVIAVFVYYFEVIARYVFNSPTNWAHEGMYLMFGMQYLVAGAYAMLTESHVRVDVLYANMSARRKAIVNLLTSVFFFIFAGTLLVTCYIFAFDAIAVPSGNSVVSNWARGQIGFFEMLGSLTLGDWTNPNIRWGEISFNEWEVPLWPMKWVMVMGALLLILQGISRLAQDVRTVVRGA
ncbi:MAG: TRAP transporter small permease subunit [Rhizobiaceae bacterium]|nr:TRAP transporter small permease subunit [Rhizobiaceae bacterium]